MATKPMSATEPTVAVPATAIDPRVGSVLVVGPGLRGRGGIAAVIRMHQRTLTWSRRSTRLLSTFDDRSAFHKILSALTAYMLAPFRLMQADVVHLHLAAQTSILRKLPIMFMARLMRRPVIVHVHAPSTESLFERTPTWAMRYLFRSAARVVALSQIWADAFQAYEPLTRVVVMANPVRIFNPNQPVIGSPQVILFVGKLDARKGYNDLLNAAVEVLREFPAVQFWFAGHGEVEIAQQLADQLGIGASVRLLGWVDGDDLGEIYRQAHIVTLPSYAEGVPMSIIEAMSYGIPVVCTPVGGLPELIRDGENGLFVTPGDVPALSRQIKRILADPQLAATLGETGRMDVQRSCSIENISEQLDALYADVLGEGRPSEAVV